MAFDPGSDVQCPHCDRPVSEGGGPSDEHIFPETFGGRTTITACTNCNSGIGTAVEGKLLISNAALTVLNPDPKSPRKELLASNTDGEFWVDLPSGKHTAKLKVTESSTEVQVFGTPEDARKVLQGMALKGKIDADEIDGLIANGLVNTEVSNDLTMTITLDLQLVRKLIAKVSLCALTYLQGDVFISTSMAAWLRQVLDAPRYWGMGRAQPEQPDPGGSGAIDNVDSDALFRSFWNQLGVDEPATSGHDENVCEFIIWPNRSNMAEPKTTFVLKLQGTVLPTGLVVPDLPREMFAPTLFSDSTIKRASIVDLASGLPNGH